MISIEKIEELFDIMDLESTLANIIPIQDERSNDLRSRFLDSYLSTTVKNKIIKEVKVLFRTFLTEEEIDGLISFYKSNAGQGILKKMPLLNKEAISIGRKVTEQMMSDEKLDEEFEMWKDIIEEENKPKILH